MQIAGFGGVPKLLLSAEERLSAPGYMQFVKPVPKDGGDGAVRIWCISIALILGFVDVLMNRFYVSFDGVSYLDMADAYLRRDWHTAINGFWNPLYSWIIAIAFALFHPNAYWQYPVVQFANYFIYAGTVAAFEYFVQGLVKEREDAAAIRIIAYGLFVWTSLGMIRVWMVNPDMFVALSIYLALGIMLRPQLRGFPVLLGITLAAGYYAKSVMIPIGVIILASGWKLVPHKKLVKSALVFALLCLPLIMMLSRLTGHLSIGETGRLNYAWWVDGVEDRNWRGGPERAGEPVHPAQLVLDHPRVYEDGGVFPVTYPMWYDVSYWFRGLRVWPAPRRFVRNFGLNAFEVGKVMLLQGGGFLVGWLVLFRRSSGCATPSPSIWYLWSAAALGILLYCAVHCETRYLGAFFTVLFLVPFVALRLHKVKPAIVVTVAGLCCGAMFLNVSMGEKLQQWQSTPVNVFWQEASGLQKLGLRPGDNVGLASGGEGMQDSRWARLAKVHIVAEVDRHVDFWKLDSKQQKQVLAALAASGAKEAVSDVPPPNNAAATGWVNVGPIFVHSLIGDHPYVQAVGSSRIN